MKKIALISIAAVFIVSSFATTAVAGFEPSPFHQLSAISLHVKVLGKQVDDSLGAPPNDQMPGEVKKAVLELHNIGFDLAGFNRDYYYWWGDRAELPPASVEEIDLDAAKKLKREVKKIINSIDAFHDFPPDPIAPEFRGATLNVRGQAVILLKTVKEIIRKIEELLACGATEIFGVCNRVLCELIELEQSRARITLTGPSEIHLESDFFSEFTIVTMEYSDRSFDITRRCKIEQYPLPKGGNHIVVSFDTFDLPIGPRTWAQYKIELFPMPIVPDCAKLSDSLWILTNGQDLTE